METTLSDAGLFSRYLSVTARPSMDRCSKLSHMSGLVVAVQQSGSLRLVHTSCFLLDGRLLARASASTPTTSQPHASRRQLPNTSLLLHRRCGLSSLGDLVNRRPKLLYLEDTDAGGAHGSSEHASSNGSAKPHPPAWLGPSNRETNGSRHEEWVGSWRDGQGLAANGSSTDTWMFQPQAGPRVANGSGMADDTSLFGMERSSLDDDDDRSEAEEPCSSEASHRDGGSDAGTSSITGGSSWQTVTGPLAHGRGHSHAGESARGSVNGRAADVGDRRESAGRGWQLVYRRPQYRGEGTSKPQRVASGVSGVSPNEARGAQQGGAVHALQVEKGRHPQPAAEWRAPAPQPPSPSPSPSTSETLKERLLFLESLGLDMDSLLEQGLLHLANRPVAALSRRVNCLRQLGLAPKEVAAALIACPELASAAVGEVRLRASAHFLERVAGVADKRRVHMLAKCPRLLLAPVDLQLRPAFEYLQELGIPQLPKVLSRLPSLLLASVESRLRPRMRELEELGFASEDARQMVRRNPALLRISSATSLQPKLAFLTQHMERGLEEAVDFPQFFCFSLEGRIQSRHELLEQHGIRLTLEAMLARPDQAFFAGVADILRRRGERCEGASRRPDGAEEVSEGPELARKPNGSSVGSIAHAALEPNGHHHPASNGVAHADASLGRGVLPPEGVPWDLTRRMDFGRDMPAARTPG